MCKKKNISIGKSCVDKIDCPKIDLGFSYSRYFINHELKTYGKTNLKGEAHKILKKCVIQLILSMGVCRHSLLKKIKDLLRRKS